MTNVIYKHTILALLMIAASVTAYALRPNAYLADTGPELSIETLIPRSFASWEELKLPEQIVNPLRQQSLDKFYAQVLSRSYVNDKGNMVMLSIAYGKDQSDEKQVHYPEVCYPAQGFNVTSIQEGVVTTEFGDIPVKRLLTELGRRKEPITYWTTVGNKVVLNGFQAKKEQLSYGFQGYIPDGLVFRVSSIDSDSNTAFKLQKRFISDLLRSINADARLKLAGIKS